MGSGFYVFRAGKAMRKKGIGNGWGIIGKVQTGSQPLSGFICKFKLFKIHEPPKICVVNEQG
jgi:hypothetical protein